MARVAVIGAGTMGRRLAADFVRYRHDVTMYDVRPGAAAEARRWVAEVVEGWVSSREVAGTADDVMRRLRPAGDLASCVADADFAFENVPEKLALKRALFVELASLLAERTIIVSNTSSLPGSLMHDASGRSDRFINANFGHLGHAKVEVMGHPGTSGPTRDATVSFLRSCGFVPLVLEKEQFGYASNRLWRAVKKEVLRQLQAGVVSAHDIDRAWMLDWHVPLGPCALMDRIGLDVVADIEQAYADHLGDPGEAAPSFLHAMIAQGKRGVKAGEGFYRYPTPVYEQPGFLDGTRAKP